MSCKVTLGETRCSIQCVKLILRAKQISYGTIARWQNVIAFSTHSKIIIDEVATQRHANSSVTLSMARAFHTAISIQILQYLIRAR